MLQTAPQVFTTLIIGLLMAFAFQLVLTNLGIAVGVTALALLPGRGGSSKLNSKREKPSGSLGGTIGIIGLAAGFGILVTINSVLFAASFLSVKLSLIADPWLGGILGIVIWSAYLLILTWVSTTTISSIAGSIFSSLTAGLQAMIATAKAVFNNEKPEDEPVPTGELLRQDIRQEVKAALDDANIQDLLEAYLKDLQPPQPDMTVIRRDLETLLADPGLRSLSKTTLSSNIDRQTFVELLRDRTDLSHRDVEHIVTQLEDLWQQASVDLNAELLNVLQHTNPDELTFDRLTLKLEELLNPRTSASTEKSSLLDSFQTIDFKALMGTLLKRVDLSDLDVEDIWHQIQGFKQQIFPSEVESANPSRFNIIQADVENYLLSAYPWNLERKTVQLEFEDVIYDADAEPNQVRPQLEQLSRDDFASLLTQRNDISAKKVSQIADRLESVRVEVLQKIYELDAQEQSKRVFLQVEDFFRTTKKVSLKAKSIQRAAKTLLADVHSGVAELEKTLHQFDRTHLSALIDDQDELQEVQLEERLDELEALRDRLLAELQTLPEVLQADIETRWQKLESYLLHTATERLTPKNVKRKLQNLFKDSLLDVLPVDVESTFFEREKWLSLLKRRQKLTSDAVQQIADQIETTWKEMATVAKPAQHWSEEAYDDAVSQLIDYIQKFNWTDLNPADFKQSLLQWMKNPNTEAIALALVSGSNAAAIKNSLMTKLYDRLQQQGLPDLHIRQLINRLSDVLRYAAKAPRRWATRAKSKPQDFGTQLQDYLLYSEPSQLSNSILESNLQRLLEDFRAEIFSSELQDGDTVGVAALGDRIPQLHPTALKATLSQRDDISEPDLETIVQTIEATGNRWIDDLEHSRDEASQRLTSVLAKLRSYFDALNLPDVSAELMEQQLHNLLHLPQQGLDVLSTSLDAVLENSPLPSIAGISLDDLRDRLQQFNRDALARVLKGRDDISQHVAGRLLEHIEGTRDRLLTNVEMLQQQAQHQLDALKQEAQRQVAATRRAAAIAAWLLFSITLTSGVTSAIAGFLAAS